MNVGFSPLETLREHSFKPTCKGDRPENKMGKSKRISGFGWEWRISEISQ